MTELSDAVKEAAESGTRDRNELLKNWPKRGVYIVGAIVTVSFFWWLWVNVFSLLYQPWDLPEIRFPSTEDTPAAPAADTMPVVRKTLLVWQLVAFGIALLFIAGLFSGKVRTVVRAVGAVVMIYVLYLFITTEIPRFVAWLNDETAVTTSPVGVWSSEEDVTIGCGVRFAAGHGDWYKVRYRLYNTPYRDHITGLTESMSHFQYMFLKERENPIPYREVC